MSLQNSVGPYNTGTLYRSVERIVGHSVTWVCVRPDNQIHGRHWFRAQSHP